MRERFIPPLVFLLHLLPFWGPLAWFSLLPRIHRCSDPICRSSALFMFLQYLLLLVVPRSMAFVVLVPPWFLPRWPSWFLPLSSHLLPVNAVISRLSPRSSPAPVPWTSSSSRPYTVTLSVVPTSVLCGPDVRPDSCSCFSSCLTTSLALFFLASCFFLPLLTQSQVQRVSSENRLSPRFPLLVVLPPCSVVCTQNPFPLPVPNSKAVTKGGVSSCRVFPCLALRFTSYSRLAHLPLCL